MPKRKTFCMPNGTTKHSCLHRDSPKPYLVFSLSRNAKINKIRFHTPPNQSGHRGWPQCLMYEADKSKFTLNWVRTTRSQLALVTPITVFAILMPFMLV